MTVVLHYLSAIYLPSLSYFFLLPGKGFFFSLSFHLPPDDIPSTSKTAREVYKGVYFLLLPWRHRNVKEGVVQEVSWWCWVGMALVHVILAMTRSILI